MQVVGVLAFAVQAAQGGVVERFDAEEHRAHPSLGEHSDCVRGEGFGPDVDRERDSSDQALRGEGVAQGAGAPVAGTGGAPEVGVSEGEPGGAGEPVQVGQVSDGGGDG